MPANSTLTIAGLALAALATLVALAALDAPAEAYTAVGLLFSAVFGAQRFLQVANTKPDKNSNGDDSESGSVESSSTG